MAKVAKKGKALGKAEDTELKEAPAPQEPEVKSEAVLAREAKVKPEAPAPKPGVGKDSVDVVKGEEYIRTFSKEVHGEDWKKLADEFCGKDARRTQVAPVPAVVVEWRAEKVSEAGIFEGYYTEQKKFTDKEAALVLNREVKGVVRVAR